MEQVVQQVGSGRPGGHEPPVERLLGELHRRVVGPFGVTGQDRPQEQHGVSLERHRDRCDEGSQPLAQHAQQSLADAGQVGHRDEGPLVTDVARQQFGGGHGGRARLVSQQGDLADDHSGGNLIEDLHPVVAEVADLSPTGLNEDERHRRLTLAHQHLTGFGAHWPEPLGHRGELLGSATFEERHRRQTLGTGRHQFGALPQRRRQGVRRLGGVARRDGHRPKSNEPTGPTDP